MKVLVGAGQEVWGYSTKTSWVRAYRVQTRQKMLYGEQVADSVVVCTEETRKVTRVQRITWRMTLAKLVPPSKAALRRPLWASVRASQRKHVLASAPLSYNPTCPMSFVPCYADCGSASCTFDVGMI